MLSMSLSKRGGGYTLRSKGVLVFSSALGILEVAQDVKGLPKQKKVSVNARNTGKENWCLFVVVLWFERV